MPYMSAPHPNALYVSTPPQRLIGQHPTSRKEKAQDHTFPSAPAMAPIMMLFRFSCTRAVSATHCRAQLEDGRRVWYAEALEGSWVELAVELRHQRQHRLQKWHTPSGAWQHRHHEYTAPG
eukprot:897696-Rhodomonas_salina.5